MKYQIKQTQTKKTFFGTKEIQKVYTFDTYAEALTFAIHEQIKNIDCIIDEKAITKRKPFRNMLTFIQFKKEAYNNPMHYIGTRFPENVNMWEYYIYLFTTRQFHKLKKA